MTCQSCRFFVAEAKECHRRAPMVVAKTCVISVWPTVRKEDWCGDYEDKYAATP
jgi:hypothetical protein